jgi:hypothetical protein
VEGGVDNVDVGGCGEEVIVAGVLVGHADAPRGELGLGQSHEALGLRLGFGLRCRACGYGEARGPSVSGEGIARGERARWRWQN